jgi:hypothetical protein
MRGGINMNLTQISVFLENKSGRLAEVTKVLADGGVNLRALSIADTLDFGVLRIIADDSDLALKVLADGGFAASATEVVAVELADEVGSLAKMLQVFQANDVNLEYLYEFFTRDGQKIIAVCRVENPEKTIGILASAGFRVLTKKEVSEM